MLAILSDTHGHAANTLAAARMLESFDVAAILHCGDIGTPEIPQLLAPWPTHFVFGNCDSDHDSLRAAIQQASPKHTCHGLFGDLNIEGRRIALLHSHDAKLFHRVSHSGEYDLVCYGHTHQAEHHHVGKTLILNPGALYRATPHSLAILDLETMQPTIVPL
jgi:putative phosphoesterase